MSVSASDQANKANKLPVICSADKHFYSHLTSGITTFMSCVRVAQNYVATSQHNTREEMHPVELLAVGSGPLFADVS